MCYVNMVIDTGRIGVLDQHFGTATNDVSVVAIVFPLSNARPQLAASGMRRAEGVARLD